MASFDMDTPFGPIFMIEEDGALTALNWGRSGKCDDGHLLQDAVQQLKAYCAGALTRFDLPLRVSGTGVQKAVCDAMSAIPFGETVTYGDIAKQVGIPAQVVGQACGRNPISIIIPCHRVMGAKGLTGFSGAGGVETKLALLKHEGAGGFLI